MSSRKNEISAQEKQKTTRGVNSPDVVQREPLRPAHEATDRHKVAANNPNKKVIIQRKPCGKEQGRPATAPVRSSGDEGETDTEHSANRAPVCVVEDGDGAVVALEEEVDGGDVGGHQVPPRRLRVERLLQCCWFRKKESRFIHP
jgi:hypothetical protein